MTGALRLRAVDEEDLNVISACLQDGLVPVGDMMYLPTTRRFVLILNRFRWENCEAAGEPCSCYERVNCGVSFENVSRVRLRGVDRDDRQRILELLAITAEDGAVLLVFAGGGAIRLEVDHILCHLEDLGEPWPTKWRPSHPLEESA